MRHCIIGSMSEKVIHTNGPTGSSGMGVLRDRGMRLKNTSQQIQEMV